MFAIESFFESLIEDQLYASIHHNRSKLQLWDSGSVRGQLPPPGQRGQLLLPMLLVPELRLWNVAPKALLRRPAATQSLHRCASARDMAKPLVSGDKSR